MRERAWALLLLAFVVAGVNVDPALGAAQLQQRPSSSSRQSVEAFEKRLLAMFGLQSRPRPKRHTAVSDYMWELYDRQSRHGTHRRSETIRCFRAEEEDLLEDLSRHVFDVSGLQENEEIRAAELVLPRQQTLGGEPLLRVSVYDVMRPPTSNDSEPILRLLDSKLLRSADPKEWARFDVLPAVHRWRRDSDRNNHGLHVEVSSTCSSPSVLRRHRRDSGGSLVEPILVTYSKDPSSQQQQQQREHQPSRTKRSATTRKGHRRKGRKDSCRRHALFVDFSDVGWNDWIIAPPGYDAYYCHGDCPYPLSDHHNTTNHAIVQTLVNSVNPKAVPRACCVPTELSGISMLYKDKYDNVVLKNYKDMVVEGCGCR